jgi:hypothetical protein
MRVFEVATLSAGGETGPKLVVVLGLTFRKLSTIGTVFAAGPIRSRSAAKL